MFIDIIAPLFLFPELLYVIKCKQKFKTKKLNHKLKLFSRIASTNMLKRINFRTMNLIIRII